MLVWVSTDCVLHYRLWHPAQQIRLSLRLGFRLGFLVFQ